MQQSMTLYSKFFAFTLLSALVFTVFGGAAYAQENLFEQPTVSAATSTIINFTKASVKGTYAIGVRNILPNQRNNESVAAIGLLRFDGNGNFVNLDTMIYTVDTARATPFAIPLPNVSGTYTIKPDGIGQLNGLVGLPPSFPPTIFIIKRAECGIATEIFIVLGSIGEDGGLVTLPATLQQWEGKKCNN
jgi:hypothetical protein